MSDTTTAAHDGPMRRRYTLIGVSAVLLSVLALVTSLVSHLAGSFHSGGGSDGGVEAARSSSSVTIEAGQNDSDPADRLTEQAEHVIAQGGGSLESVYVDRDAGVVVASALAVNLPTLQRAVINDPDVRVEAAPGRATVLAGPMGGEGIIAGARGCTAGFNATRRGVPVLITAGHCLAGASSVRYRNTLLGAVTGNDFPRSDIGFVTGSLRTTGPGTVRIGPEDSVAVKGVRSAGKGAKVCKSGATTGWTCGTVLATDVTLRVGLPTGATALVRGLTKTNACARAGDSGGPWVSGGYALGVTSSAVTYAGRCGQGTGRPTVSYMQPLGSTLSSYGLTLVTG